MDPTRGDSRYNLNYSMSSIGLSLTDQADMYGNSAGRPPSAGILQGIGSVGGPNGGGLLPRSSGTLISNTQCQSLGNSVQQRGLKRAGSDCYDDSHQRVGASSIATLQGLDNCGSSSNVLHSNQQQPHSSSAGVQDIVDDSYNNLQSKKSPPANGKKTKGRVKIKMEYIDNKLRRYTTFSKRKTGIMKKAYELSTLTGTQVMLLVASETGHVYTFATRKLQPMITSEAGKQLIQTCLNSPDPPSLGGGDQRMSATGFEETELSYNIADEDSKEVRSPVSSINDSEDSSENDGVGNIGNINTNFNEAEDTTEIDSSIGRRSYKKKEESAQGMHFVTLGKKKEKNTLLIEAGQLELHNEEDGSGHQYIAIPLSLSSKERLSSDSTDGNNRIGNHSQPQKNLRGCPSKLIIKDEHRSTNIHS